MGPCSSGTVAPQGHAVTAPLFRMTGISKRYGGVRALEGVDLAVEAGRIHAVLGENGAGKSSLIKCMAGVVQPDTGTLELDGRAVRFATPAAAMPPVSSASSRSCRSSPIFRWPTTS